MTNSTKKSKGVKYIQEKYGVTPPDLSEYQNTDCLYSIYDKCQKMFLPPFPAPTIEACIRSLKDIVSSQPSSLMAKYPTDYEIYKLAEWNNKTGYISYDVPTRISSVYDILSRKDKDEVSDEV